MSTSSYPPRTVSLSRFLVNTSDSMRLALDRANRRHFTLHLTADHDVDLIALSASERCDWMGSWWRGGVAVASLRI